MASDEEANRSLLLLFKAAASHIHFTCIFSCAREEDRVRGAIPFTDTESLDLFPKKSKARSDKVQAGRAVPVYAAGYFWQL